MYIIYTRQSIYTPETYMHEDLKQNKMVFVFDYAFILSYIHKISIFKNKTEMRLFYDNLQEKHETWI